MFYRVQLDGGKYLYLFELLHGWMNTGKPCYDIYMPIWNKEIEKGLRGNTVLAHQCTAAYKKILHFKGCWFCKMLARGTRVCAGKPSPTIGLYAYDRLVCVYPGKLCYTPDKEHHRNEFADVKAQLARGGIQSYIRHQCQPFRCLVRVVHILLHALDHQPALFWLLKGSIREVNGKL
jgi:hypothetical protein